MGQFKENIPSPAEAFKLGQNIERKVGKNKLEKLRGKQYHMAQILYKEHKDRKRKRVARKERRARREM